VRRLDLDVAGFHGHSSGYETAEGYEKFGPDHLAEATQALGAYFADLELPPACGWDGHGLGLCARSSMLSSL
jgi:hypothetical protein